MMMIYILYIYYYYYYHINVDSTFLEDGLTDHDETFREYVGWLPGGEYPRCDDVIDHTIYICYYYYYHINVDCTFLEDCLTDHYETFRNDGVWPPGFEYK